MVAASTIASFSLGNATVANDEASESLKGVLASLYNTSAIVSTGAVVTVTLHQDIDVAMSLVSDLSNEQLCHVVLTALTLRTFATCHVSTSTGGTTTFTLSYPLEGNLTAINTKTNELRGMISDPSEPLPAAMVAVATALNRRDRRLATLSVSRIETPVTKLSAQVTLVVQQLASKAGAYVAVIEQQEAVMAAASSVTTNGITAALAASGATLVEQPIVTVLLSNAPPSMPPPAFPPVPPAPPALPPPLMPPSLPPPPQLPPPPVRKLH